MDNFRGGRVVVEVLFVPGLFSVYHLIARERMLEFHYQIS